MNARIQLDDVKSEEEIDSLDIKSLKRLLLNNFVDYKGCKEKWELQERLRRLWRDNQANKKLCKFKLGFQLGSRRLDHGTFETLKGLQIRVCIGKLFSLFIIQNICCRY